MRLSCCDYCCSFFLFNSTCKISIPKFVFNKGVCFRHFYKVKKNALFRDHVRPPASPSVCLFLTLCQQMNHLTYFHEIRYRNSSRKFRLSLSSVNAPRQSYFIKERKLISARTVRTLQPMWELRGRDLTSCRSANMSYVKLCSERHTLDKGVNKLGRADVLENYFD